MATRRIIQAGICASQRVAPVSRRVFGNATMMAARTWPRQQQQRGTTPFLRFGLRYSTSAPADGAGHRRMWSFEEIQALQQSKSNPKSKSNPETPILIDVREPAELENYGRIPGAINIPIKTSPDSFHISEEEFEDRFGFARPGVESHLVFYCQAGVRGRAAAGLASDAGWRAVEEFPGSFAEWVARGGAIER
ncbi:rhodanese domain-containing protein [Xylaria intraflava]|nr:rhodanese domain-containing protein [Xylaria intraflava]